ncbi:hypothetical protein EVB91_255 [Rhizobium phage RHph_I1_18]|nr:hypothetical protein EVB91_255 [Rhizobium phage RHph_I1_18]
MFKIAVFLYGSLLGIDDQKAYFSYDECQAAVEHNYKVANDQTKESLDSGAMEVRCMTNEELYAYQFTRKLSK